MIIFQTILVGGAGINIGAIIVGCFGIDIGRQLQQVSLSTAVFAVDPPARARMNSVMIISIFLGQVMGTSVGSKVFLENGWRAAAGLSMAWMGWQMAILLSRGPHCERKTWVGWQGGMEIRRSKVESRAKARHEHEQEQEHEGSLESGTPSRNSDANKKSSENEER